MGAGKSSYMYPTNSCPAVSDSAAKEFISLRSLVHEKFIVETHKTKRLGIGCSAALLGAACVTPLVAPEGREVISWWVGGGLATFAAGAMGYTHMSMKAAGQRLKLKR
jgi:hypothetical protein